MPWQKRRRRRAAGTPRAGLQRREAVRRAVFIGLRRGKLAPVSGIVYGTRRPRRGRQTHAPFVMRGRARRTTPSRPFAPWVMMLLRKVAPSSVVDVREHSVRLRDGGRLYAPSSRSMRVEEALSNRDRHVVTASCDALGEAASALRGRRRTSTSEVPRRGVTIVPRGRRGRLVDICGRSSSCAVPGRFH